MERKINIIEAASELAHKKLVEEVGDENLLFEDPEASIQTYTDEHQDTFNDLYDEYYSLLLDISEDI
jgi:hypothetical protein